MSDFKFPPKKTASPFAGWRGHHVGVRVKDLNEAKNWYVEKLDFRVVHEWPYADEQLAYIAPPNDDAFLVELLGGAQGRIALQAHVRGPEPVFQAHDVRPEVRRVIVGRAVGVRISGRCAAADTSQDDPIAADIAALARAASIPSSSTVASVSGLGNVLIVTSVIAASVPNDPASSLQRS